MPRTYVGGAACSKASGVVSADFVKNVFLKKKSYSFKNRPDFDPSKPPGVLMCTTDRLKAAQYELVLGDGTVRVQQCQFVSGIAGSPFIKKSQINLVQPRSASVDRVSLAKSSQFG